MRRLGCALLLSAAGVTFAGNTSNSTSPSLVVVFVVDQLPSGTLERFQNHLSGGYRRFLDEGLNYTDCRHAHALTMTAPGHATLLSGLDPRNNGIILNDWFDREAHRETYCVGDYSGGAKPDFDGGQAVSSANLLGESLGDLIKRVSPGSKVYTVAGKDRSAILTGGHHADGSFWYSTRTGGFTSNPSIVAQLPEWGAPFWGGDVISTPLYRNGIPAQWTHPVRPGASVDDDPFEGVAYSRVSPHPLMKPQERVGTIARRILYSPWLDWLILQFATRVIDQMALGADAAPDLLVLGLSGADIVGHTYGPASQEYLDLTIRVDGWLGEFMRHAERSARRGGRGGVLFALSADHGVLPLPERIEGGRRIDGADLNRRIEVAIAARLAKPGGSGQDRFVEAIRDGNLYLDRRTLESLNLPLDRAVEETVRALSGFGEISRIYRGAELAASADSPGDPFLDSFRRSWEARRGGDLVLQYCERCIMVSAATGTDHGSPYDYDRRVPMMLLGPGIGAARKTGACATVDLAPTLAGALRMTFEKPRDGVDLLNAAEVDRAAGHQ